jgi:uncharacterized protein YjbI with pentapeptide repeats
MEGGQRPWWLWALAGLVALAALAAIILAIWKLPSLLYGDVSKASPDARLQAASGFRTALVAGLAGLAALGGLAMATRTYRLTQQGQITDRYTKAIDQIGSDKLETRLGGIYALERIAVDSERDHRTVVEVLGAFAREQGGPPTSPNSTEVASVERGGTDVVAAVTVLGRLPDRFDTSRAELASVYLVRAVLNEANLHGVGLGRANLAAANLVRANLRGAYLLGADLQAAGLRGADLVGAVLVGANLQGALLESADMTNAVLAMANLQRAILWLANLHGADLQEADLRGAHLRGAHLRGALLDRVQLQGAECDANTVWPDGFDWKAAGVMLRDD